ncbi:MAG: NUDIX domain-containing protein [Patescibacteria group bacterium]
MKHVKAIIIENNKILLLKRNREGRIYWVFPGGQVESGETDEQALKREVKEEVGVDVSVGKLIFQTKYKLPKKETKEDEYFYLCRYIGGEIGTGQGPEYQPNSGYVGTYEPQWVAIKDLRKMKVLPEEVKNLVPEKFL